MGDPVSTAALAVGTTGLKVAGNIAEGSSKKVAAQIDALKAKTAAEAGKVRAIQTDAQYRDDLRSTLAAIDVFRTGQNVSIDSPTAMALNAEAQKRSDRARMTAVSNERMKALGLDADANALIKGADQYTKAALLKSAPDILSAGQAIYKAF